MEETTREREERLKGWSAFLDGGEQPQKNSEPQAGEDATTTTTVATTTATAVEHTELDSTTRPDQQGESQAEEQEVDSTDSSLAGSEDDEA